MCLTSCNYFGRGNPVGLGSKLRGNSNRGGGRERRLHAVAVGGDHHEHRRQRRGRGRLPAMHLSDRRMGAVRQDDSAAE